MYLEPRSATSVGNSSNSTVDISSLRRTNGFSITLGFILNRCYSCDNHIVPAKNRNQVIHECQLAVERHLQIKQSKMRGI